MRSFPVGIKIIPPQVLAFQKPWEAT